MKKFLYRIFIYCVIIFAVLNTISLVVLHIHKESNLFKPSYVVNNFDDTSKFDYIILGSSTALMGVNTHVIDSVCTTKGFNLAIDGGTPFSNKLMLLNFLNQGGTAKTCILSVDSWNASVENYQLASSIYQYLPLINNDKIYKQLRNEESLLGDFPIMSGSRYFPALGVMYYNAQIFYSSILAVLDPDKQHNFDDSGNYAYPNTCFTPKSTSDQMVKDLKLLNKDIVEIKNICDKNNIELILYIPPVYNTRLNIIDNNNRVIFNYSDYFDGNKYFYDGGHINGLGRDIVSLSLSKDLLEVLN